MLGCSPGTAVIGSALLMGFVIIEFFLRNSTGRGVVGGVPLQVVNLGISF